MQYHSGIDIVRITATLHYTSRMHSAHHQHLSPAPASMSEDIGTQQHADAARWTCTCAHTWQWSSGSNDSAGHQQGARAHHQTALPTWMLKRSTAQSLMESLHPVKPLPLAEPTRQSKASSMMTIFAHSPFHSCGCRQQGGRRQTDQARSRGGGWGPRCTLQRALGSSHQRVCPRVHVHLCISNVCIHAPMRRNAAAGIIIRQRLLAPGSHAGSGPCICPAARLGSSAHCVKECTSRRAATGGTAATCWRRNRTGQAISLPCFVSATA